MWGLVVGQVSALVFGVSPVRCFSTGPYSCWTVGPVEAACAAAVPWQATDTLPKARGHVT